MSIKRLNELTSHIYSTQLRDIENLKRLELLYEKLGLNEKIINFDDVFDFKAINLSGVSLSKNSLGEITKGKYLQIIGILYDKNAKVKSKNISIAYYGRIELVDEKLKNDVIKFVLSWRYEKSVRNLKSHAELLDKIYEE